MMHTLVLTTFLVSSARVADQPQEPFVVSQAPVGSATGPVSHQQPSDQTFLPGLVSSQPQVASPAASTTQSQQPSQQPSQVFSTDPSLAQPLSRASSWDTTPQATGDQGYPSPLIYLYSDLETLYDIPSDRVPVSYEDLQEAPSASEMDPTKSESLHTEEQSYRETVRAIKSYMKWYLSQIMNMSATHNP